MTYPFIKSLADFDRDYVFAPTDEDISPEGPLRDVAFASDGEPAHWFCAVIRAVDGTHRHVSRSEAGALRRLAKHLGYENDDAGKPLVAGRSYHDSIGSRCFVEAMPRGIKTVRQMEALGDAYDARECGTATKRQLALLERANY